ncbi:hypothetical protein MUK42_06816 [Musa troglodytarum]|uniref:Uncharacterized protein n=1 Tax=Musa troglodytarum TaxID=320322 RepID=A0A9E7JXU4_9LILI|nr:hypothetical protein MUK42_06816 [Musa troglodytarum]
MKEDGGDVMPTVVGGLLVLLWSSVPDQTNKGCDCRRRKKKNCKKERGEIGETGMEESWKRFSTPQEDNDVFVV